MSKAPGGLGGGLWMTPGEMPQPRPLPSGHQVALPQFGATQGRRGEPNKHQNKMHWGLKVAQRKYKSSYIYPSLEFEDEDSHSSSFWCQVLRWGLRKSANVFFSVRRWSHLPSVPTRELDSAVCDFTLGLKVTHKPLLLGCHLGPHHWAPGWAVYCRCFLTLQS